MSQKSLQFIYIILLATGLYGIVFSLNKFIHKPSVGISAHELSQKENLVPVVVIGSGCAGYAAALYGARGKMKTVLLAGNQPGGQLSGTTRVENFPALVDQLGPDIMQKMQKQAEQFGVEIVYDTVQSIDCSKYPYEVRTQGGKDINALTIVYTTGASPVTLGVTGEDEYWGKGVTTCAICDAPFHKGKDVIVVGGGDSAIEEALQLSSYARSVTIVVRKDYMRAAPSMQDRLKAVENVSVMYNAEVKKINGSENEGVSSVELYSNKTQEASLMEVSGVFLAIGHKPNSALLRGCVDLDSDGYIKTKGKSQETSMAGIFAAGDVEDKVYRQAGVAAGSGIKAALDALSFLQAHGFNAALAEQLEPNYFSAKKAAAQKQSNVAIETITSANDFDQIRTKHAVVVVDFYANFCPSCTYFTPTFESVAQQLPDITFVKVNIDDVPSLANRYKISSIPTIMIFKNSERAGSTIGAVSEAEFKAFIKKVL